MVLKTSRWFRVLLALALAASFVLTPAVNTLSAATPEVQEAPSADEPAAPPEAPALNQRAEAVRLGKWPAQAVASYGSIQPSLQGPQRTDPAEGIPTHAYSPFDERRNREYPCPPRGCDYETGHVLVKLATGVEVAPPTRQAAGQFTGEAALDATLRGQGVVRLEPIFPTADAPRPDEKIEDPDGMTLPKPDLTRWYRATFESAVTDVYATVEVLAKAPGVAWVEPDYLRKPVGEFREEEVAGNPEQLRGTLPPDRALPAHNPEFTDPLYGQQWHLPAVHAPEAWAYLQSQGLPPGGRSDVVVAVIDTGVDYTHPDLAANMWINAPEFSGVTGVDDDHNGFIDDKYGADTVTPDGNPTDDHGHGTHVAGIIAARADNGIGGVGVAYTSRIMAIKAAQYSGVLASSDIAEAIYYAVQKGAQVINMSFGGYARSQVEEDALAIAFGQAVLLAAAGNDAKVNLPCPGRDMYPAAYNWVLGVMASTSSGSRAGFSNFDCTPHDTHEYELLAPGVDVWSTLPGSQYAAWDGTSMSAPVVSGIAVLARTRWSDPDLYSSRFIMGQIAANALPVANAQTALTVPPQPELSYLEHWLFDTEAQSTGNDDDGIVDSGETIDLAIVIRNHWGKADPVNVTLEAWAEGAYQPDPYVTMIVDTVNYGAIGSFNQDDNGLIYDNQGAITGVQFPFRFSVDPNTPNDHIIPFRLTMTAGNGYDPTDPNAPYTFVSRFFLIVQRGTELPTIISQDMTLTKDHYWLVPDQTLIQAGVVVTIMEGTQIQFWSTDPADPYHQNVKPLIQVEGTLRVMGTAEEPVQMFSGANYPGYAVEIKQMGNASQVELQYAHIRNPLVGYYADNGRSLTRIDHCYFDLDLAHGIKWKETRASPVTTTNPAIRALSVSYSIFHKLGFLTLSGGRHSLYDTFNVNGDHDGLGNVFLKITGQAQRAGYSLYSPVFARSVFPVTQVDKTYLTVSGRKSVAYVSLELMDAELYAQQLGGHVVSVQDTIENQFLGSYQTQHLNQAAFQTTYPGFTCGVLNCWSDMYSGSPQIGLTDTTTSGTWAWTSGDPVTYTRWSNGYPVAGGGSNVTIDTTQPEPLWRNGNRTATMPYLLELPGVWSEAQIEDQRAVFMARGDFNQFRHNAFLSPLWDPNTDHWLRLGTPSSDTDKRNWLYYANDNYWGTTSDTLIGAAINDCHDDFNLGCYVYQPALAVPPSDAYPFMADVVLSIAGNPNASIVGAGPVTFTATFNRDMDTAVQPMVSFGPDVPVTDYTVHPVNGGWQDPRTWVGTFIVTPITGDGFQLIRVAGAVAADDPWLVTGDDAGRFRFEIVTSGGSAMNLQATGGEGYVDLMWSQNDFDLLAGYNLYKSTSQNGTYTRVNQTIIPPAQHTFRDTGVQPGVPAYYKFTVVKSDMSESGFSNVTWATPIDTVPPTISHAPVTQAPPGLSLSIFADVTDNVGVQNVTLFYRHMGATTYGTLAMVRTTGNRFSATIPGSVVTAPGIEYYIEATDGISTVRSGRPEYPHQVMVSDEPTVTSVTPNRGPTGGGTSVTIAGSNFKPGATVTFGGAACSDVAVVSGSQITCSTPPHYPTAADVTVTNPGTQSDTLHSAFTFESDTASLSLPHTGGQQHALVQVPVNAAGVQGMAAASLKVVYDPAVLQVVGASTGNLTSGWNLVANTDNLGEVILWLISPGGTVTGSGVMVLIQFDVIGAPGQTSALTLQDVLLNDGAIPTETAAGSFQIEQVYSVSGSVSFWHGGVVSNTLLSLTGDRVYTGLSNAAGAYTVAGAAADDYVLTPGKADEANGISAYDASLAMQHGAELITLNSYADMAADVNRSGAISAMDAFHILQRSVDLIPLPFPGAGVLWVFDPASRSYANLSSNLTGQNFTAVLLGDVSGNWPADPVQAAPEQPNGSAVLSLGDLLAEQGDRATVALSASLSDAQLYAANLVVTYDPAILSFVSATAGSAVPDYMTAVKENEPGRLYLALAGATPLTEGGDLFTLAFDVMGETGGSPLIFERAELNEGQIGAVTDDGSVTVVQRATFTITPGWNLLTWPLLLADVTLDGSLGAQLHGSDSPDTADRVLYWDAATQSYQSAWFCGGPVCESWGEPYANRWLASDYSPSTITLPPNAGFWIQNRSSDSETLAILGMAAEGERSVPVAQGWQMLGSIFAAELPLDEANLPATGTDSPDTADRVLYWDAATQSYKSAWFCGGPECESWGEPYANHWLASDYSPTDIVIQPGHGFWYQNRHQPFTWINGR